MVQRALIVFIVRLSSILFYSIFSEIFKFDLFLDYFLLYKKYINNLKTLKNYGGCGVPASIEVCGNAILNSEVLTVALRTTLGPGSIPGSRPIIFNELKGDFQ